MISPAFNPKLLSSRLLMPWTAAVMALLTLVLSCAALRAQTTNMTGSTLSLTDWASIGSSNSASNFSLTLGTFNTADTNSVTLGDYSYAASDSMVVGYSSSAVYSSLVAGDLSGADSESVAIGSGSSAYICSLATGVSTTAQNSSLAAGSFTVAVGDSSASMGYSTTAQSYASFVVGRFNKTSAAYEQYSWVATDPLFVVGNGSGMGSQANDAFVVYKNGKIKMAQAQGDISMGAFQ